MIDCKDGRNRDTVLAEEIRKGCIMLIFLFLSQITDENHRGVTMGMSPVEMTARSTFFNRVQCRCREAGQHHLHGLQQYFFRHDQSTFPR